MRILLATRGGPNQPPLIVHQVYPPITILRDAFNEVSNGTLDFGSPTVEWDFVRAVVRVILSNIQISEAVSSKYQSDLAGEFGGGEGLWMGVSLQNVDAIAARVVYLHGPGSWEIVPTKLRGFAGRGFAGGGGDLPDNLPALVFDLRGVAERTGPGSAAALWLLAEFLLDHWVDPARPPLTVAVDEAHALLAHAVTARFLEELLRSGRKRGAGVLLLTQAIGDLLGAHADPDAARATRAALANAAAVFLMRQQNQREVAMVRALYRLGAEEARLLTTCGRGEGLLVEGRRRASVLVDVPLAMHAAFATDPDGGTPPAP